MLGHGTLTGRFAVPADPDSLATLRTAFRPLAIRYGLDDLDTAALRDGRPRGLTQAISPMALRPHRPRTGSSRRDRVRLPPRRPAAHVGALYERAADHDISPHIDVLDHSPIDAEDPTIGPRPDTPRTRVDSRLDRSENGCAATPSEHESGFRRSLRNPPRDDQRPRNRSMGRDHHPRRTRPRCRATRRP